MCHVVMLGCLLTQVDVSNECDCCRFTLKSKGDGAEEEITVEEYFGRIRNIPLQYSANLPCINVGKPKRPTYIPIEVNFRVFNAKC